LNLVVHNQLEVCENHLPEYQKIPLLN